MRAARSRFAARLLRGSERIVWGGQTRGRLFAGLTLRHYESRFRRDWWWRPHGQLPHFVDQRIGGLHAILGDDDPLCLLRGVLAAQVLCPGDNVLDLGCGDGFYSRQFFAKRCASVDAVDVEESAIRHAATQKPKRENVRFLVADAVSQPFPRPSYDVIVWDGALGHFSRDVTDQVLGKIAAALAPDGAFVGSESLGREGHDHLQFFADLGAIRDLLAPYFPVVALCQQTYRTHEGSERHEAYWHCASNEERLQAAGWQIEPAQRPKPASRASSRSASSVIRRV